MPRVDNYNRTTWINDTTPINADNLNNIEKQLYDAYNAYDLRTPDKASRYGIRYVLYNGNIYLGGGTAHGIVPACIIA